MNVGKAIYYLLANAESVTNIASTRIYPELAEQEAVAPYAVYQIVSVNPDDTNDGPAVIDEVVVDILCVAESYNEAADLATVVRSALDRVRGTYNGVNVESIQYDSTDSDVQDSPRRYEQTVTVTVRVFRDAAQIATGQDIDQLTLGRLYDVTITDPLERDALVYDSEAGEWINGIPTDIPVINKSGADIAAGAPLIASGVQGDRVEIDIWNPSNDGKLFMGLAASDIADNATGFCRQIGIVHHIDTSAWPVGTVLYPTFSGQLTDTPLPARFRSIPVAIVLRQQENTGRLFVRTWTPDYSISDLTNVNTSGKSNGRALVYDGINDEWKPGNTVPRAAYDLADVFDYSSGTLSAGSILVWDAINGYWFPQPKLSFLPDTSVYYLGQYDTEAGTGRTAASTASVTVERYLTIQGDGEGESISAQSDTPSSGNKIVRKIWYKANSFETSDVDTWTLVHTFADDTAYASTEATFEALLNAQTYGTPPFTLAQSWEDVPAFTGLLDTYSGAAAAYSLRLLDSTYTGDAINVRRASDNAVQDIGFDVNGDLDTSALATFCAGTDGYVVTWYDQSGNSNDATQVTTSAQPQIVSSGSVLTENGKPVASFDGSNDYLQTTYDNANNYTAFWVQVPVNGVAQVIGRGDLTLRYVAGYSSTDSVFFYRLGTVDIQATGARSQYLGYLLSQPLSSDCRVGYNGSTGTTSANLGTATLKDMVIGAERSANLFYGQSKIHELVLYPSDQSSNRTGIESNINTYYSIY